MITRRVSTKIQPEPPVRFYRTIAISFLVLTIVLLAVVVFFTSKKTDIVIVAKSDNKNINLSIEVGDDNSLKGMVTTTFFSWSEKYSPSSNKVVDALATGQVTIYNDSSYDQPLIKTTRLLNPDGVLFRLTEGVNVPANGQVTANVYADKKGSGGDIGPTSFTIPGLSDSRQKTVYAKSINNMSGGVSKVGVLTETDLQTAKSNYLTKVKQAYLKNLDSTGQENEIVVLIKDNSINADKAVGDEIDGFTIMGTSTVVVVEYNKADLQTVVGIELSKKIDTTSEKVLSIGKEPQVSLESYDLIEGTARLSIYQDVLVTLDANGSKLAKVNFFGKNKDEIQRYIMGLGHVVGVETKFSPSWMRSAPSVSERIKVIVKNV
ncbi:MAG: hypothetical protein ABIH87_04540 [bacterium]